MVERRPVLDLRSPRVVLIGVAIVAFPVYVDVRRLDAHARARSLQAPMPLLPGDHLLDNYSAACSAHGSAHGLERAGRPDDVEQPGHGARHRDRQDRDLAALGVRDRLLPLPVPRDLLLDDLRHPDAAGRGAHPADLQGRRRPRHAQHLRRPDACR